MTTQRDDATQPGLDEPRPEGLLPTVIYENVSDEEIALENEALSEGDAPEAEAPVVEEAASELEAPAEPQQEEAPVEQPSQAQGVEQPPVAAEQEPEPEPRVFTQDEVAKMQSAWYKQIEQEKQRAQEAAEKIAAYDLDAKVEAELRQQEQQYVAEYGQDGARNIVRNESNIRMVRQAHEAQRQAAQMQEQQKTAAEQAELQAKNTVAQQLMQQHSLSADDYGILLNTTDPNAMVQLASRLAANQQAVVREQKKQIVPPETPATRLEGGPSGDGAETEQNKTDRISSKPAYQWSREEAEHMRRLSYGG